MSPFKKTLCISFIVYNLAACSLGPRKGVRIDYPQELEQVFLLVSQDKSDLSLRQIQTYLDRSEKLHWHGHAYYLQGRVHQGQKNWDKAIDSYRKAILQSNAFDSAVEAQSLYRLSQVYEQTGQRQEWIASLVDLMKRRTFFDQLIADVEIPARLAAAYASRGQMDKAQEFHKLASSSFQEILRAHGNHLSENDIAKSRYYLGMILDSNHRNDFLILLSQLNLGQSYLLAASEMESTDWSEKSEQALLQSYIKLWELLNQQQGPEELSHDPAAQQKQKQIEQLNRASDFYDLALRLEEERTPKTHPQSRAGEILRQVQRWRLRLEKFASNLSLGPEVTRRQKIKNRPLLNKIVSPAPAPAVFKEAVRTQPSRDENKLPPKQIQKRPDNEIGEDPNL